MALDYTIKYAEKFAERFRKAPLTSSAAGNEFEFTDAKGVRIYSMTPEPLSDYGRGSTRFGSVTDLAFTTQEMICSQEKAFTKHIEALDDADIAPDAVAGKFLRMEIDEVINPTMDKYRFRKWVEGAGVFLQQASITSSNVVEKIEALKGAMLDELVPDANLTLFVNTTVYVALKQADAVVDLEELGTRSVERGVVGFFDNMRVVPVPSSYFPSGVHFMIKAPRTTVDPVKLAQYQIIRGAVGYSGPVLQGLAYYDAFVLGVRCAGIGVCGTSSVRKAAPSVALDDGGTSVTITRASGTEFLYTTDGSDPRWSTTAIRVTTSTASVDIPEDGSPIRVYSVADNKIGAEVSVSDETPEFLTEPTLTYDEEAPTELSITPGEDTHGFIYYVTSGGVEGTKKFSAVAVTVEDLSPGDEVTAISATGLAGIIGIGDSYEIPTPDDPDAPDETP